MSTIDKLFGRSPFQPLQMHMQQVTQCVAGMGRAIECVLAGSWDEVADLAKQVSELEHRADQIKDDIRNQLPRPLFLAVNRQRVLDILAIQDRIADNAEDLCILFTLKRVNLYPRVVEKFSEFRDLNLRAFDVVEQVIGQIDELVEAGFGGAEAEKVRNLVHDVARTEHEADLVQRELLKELFAAEHEMSYGDFYLWTRIIRQLGNISNESENLANRVRATLELK